MHTCTVGANYEQDTKRQKPQLPLLRSQKQKHGYCTWSLHTAPLREWASHHPPHLWTNPTLNCIRDQLTCPIPRLGASKGTRYLVSLPPAVAEVPIKPCWISSLASYQFLLIMSAVLSHFSCVQLCNPMDCSPPTSDVREILQARILEWVAKESKNPDRQRNQLRSNQFINQWAAREECFFSQLQALSINLVFRKENIIGELWGRG